MLDDGHDQFGQHLAVFAVQVITCEGQEHDERLKGRAFVALLETMSSGDCE
jgi:hypothetical protein